MHKLASLKISHRQTWLHMYGTRTGIHKSENGVRRKPQCILVAWKGNIPMVEALLRAGFSNDGFTWAKSSWFQSHECDDWACIHTATLHRIMRMSSVQLLLGTDFKVIAVYTHSKWLTSIF